MYLIINILKTGYIHLEIDPYRPGKLFQNLTDSPEEGDCIGVAAALHLADLLPRPVVVELRGPHERQVDAERAVDARAVDADEDAVRHRGPRGVLAAAVETYLRGEGQYVN